MTTGNGAENIKPDKDINDIAIDDGGSGQDIGGAGQDIGGAGQDIGGDDQRQDYGVQYTDNQQVC